MNKITILLCLMACTVSFAQKSRTERKIVQSIDAHASEALKLLETSVNINSGTMNFEGVKAVGLLFKKEFDALGMEAEWVDGAEWGRAGHLVARQNGGQGKTILLIGHIDTVFEPSSPFQEYKVVNDTLVSGPGVGDMKGGDVIIIEALRALKAVGALQKMNIIVVMTGDEELSGRPLKLSKRELVEAAKIADIAIGFEDGDGTSENAVTVRRGSAGWTLKVEGTPAHSSQVFSKDVGAGAIYEASRILNAFYEKLQNEKDLTYNPGIILGGTAIDYDRSKNGGTAYGKSNIVAKEVIARGDLRAVSIEQLERAHNVMREIVAANRPKTKATITFGEGYPPLTGTDGNTKLLAFFSDISEELGFGKVHPVNPRNAGAADISFTSGHVDMAMDGMGMRSWGGHTVHETADPRSLAMEAKRAAVLLYRLTRTKGKGKM